MKNSIKPHKIKFNEKIAVIGSGPAGLTAALRLREKGYRTTLYKALSRAGGVMKVGIPEFRLLQNILDEEKCLRIDCDRCKGCGICFYECPCSAKKT